MAGDPMPGARGSPRPRPSQPVFVLLPPSEGKAPDDPAQAGPRAAGNRRRGSWDPASGRFGALASKRAEVADALAGASGGDRRLLGVGGEHLEAARVANAALVGAPTLPAWRRYTGVVWAHLDAAERRRILVVTALHGVVRGDDPVPYYRLKMSANLPPLGKLSAWWRDDLSATIDMALRRSFVVDLLPLEHRAAWHPSAASGVRVELVDPSGASGGHLAKAAKGRLARAILRDGIDVLDTWRDERFVLDIGPLDPRLR
jgi:uncharacterized protein